jgi:hypothetical protein
MKTRLGVEWLETRETPSDISPIDPTGLNPPDMTPPVQSDTTTVPGTPIAPTGTPAH